MIMRNAYVTTLYNESKGYPNAQCRIDVTLSKFEPDLRKYLCAPEVYVMRYSVGYDGEIEDETELWHTGSDAQAIRRAITKYDDLIDAYDSRLSGGTDDDE